MENVTISDYESITSESFSLLKSKHYINSSDIISSIRESLSSFMKDKEKFFLSYNKFEEEAKLALDNINQDHEKILHQIESSVDNRDLSSNIKLLFLSIEKLLKASIVSSFNNDNDLTIKIKESNLSVELLFGLDDNFHLLDLELIVQKSLSKVIFLLSSIKESYDNLKKKSLELEECLFNGKKYLNYFSFDNTKQFYVEVDKDKEIDHVYDNTTVDNFNLSKSEYEVKKLVLKDMLMKIMYLLEGHEHKIDRRLIKDIIFNLESKKLNGKTKKQIMQSLSKYLNFSDEQNIKLGIELVQQCDEMFIDASLEACYETIKELITFLET